MRVTFTFGLKVKLFSRHIGKTPEEIEADIRRPKYFSPSEAVEYGIIDKVVLFTAIVVPLILQTSPSPVS